ncbi:hypothetical protein [Nocardia sp. XZ_19_231]|uniref:hypothetical protein n=1 Tax=Nocardia sp. XZ_19_231 TaxID=2769252 RepID=UPI00188E48A9|nr:hypothetical protein [Nocardia sp. XZ_19_231]
MTAPFSPRLLKGGLVLIDPQSAVVRKVIALQYNPDTLSRGLQVRGVGTEGGDRSEALRLTGPPTETIKLDAEIDATDQLEDPARHADAAKLGIFPQLAALETLVYPTSGQLAANNNLAGSGTLEVLPMETDLALFVWSKSRIVPVRVTEFSVTEEAFDAALNPIRAKVSLGLRVLSVDDVGFTHKGGDLFMSYLRQKEEFARRGGTVLGALGLTGVPS